MNSENKTTGKQEDAKEQSFTHRRHSCSRLELKIERGTRGVD